MLKDHSAKERWEYLLKQYLANTCSKEEMAELFSLMEDLTSNEALLHPFQEYWNLSKEKGPSDNRQWDELFLAMMHQTRDMAPLPKPNITRGPRQLFRLPLVAAAVILLLAGVLFWRMFYNTDTRHRSKPSRGSYTLIRYRNDVMPGGNKALLTLANGTTVILDSMKNGVLCLQGGTKVVKKANGELIYEVAAGNNVPGGDSISYNTISTPRGGQYQVVLPDGSKVWLNANSSLRFPTRFAGNTRQVELSGEAYFEVIKNVSNPLRVMIIPQLGHKGGAAAHQLEVLGTSFNVMAYDEEKEVRTTLLEGALRITDAGGKDGNILKPGQQAETKEGSRDVHIVSDVDVEASIAWKKGYFNFDKADIHTVMRQLSRWYDIQVSYSGNGEDKVFWGGMQRDLPLSDVFRILEKSGVEFTIDGKKVVVNM